MIPYHIGNKNLAGARVVITGTHSVGGGGYTIFNATITSIVGVEIGVVFGIIARLDSVFESGSLKCLVPIFNAFFHGTAPLLGERAIDIEHDFLLRLHESAGKIGIALLVFRLKTPAMDN